MSTQFLPVVVLFFLHPNDIQSNFLSTLHLRLVRPLLRYYFPLLPLILPGFSASWLAVPGTGGRPGVRWAGGAVREVCPGGQSPGVHGGHPEVHQALPGQQEPGGHAAGLLGRRWVTWAYNNLCPVPLCKNNEQKISLCLWKTAREGHSYICNRKSFRFTMNQNPRIHIKSTATRSNVFRVFMNGRHGVKGRVKGD